MEVDIEPVDDLLLSGEEIFMREHIERRYARDVWLKQEMIVTIHRLIFRGETRENFSMELPYTDVRQTKMGKNPLDKSKLVPVFGVAYMDTAKVDLVIRFNSADPQSLTKVRLLDKFINKVKNPLAFGDQRKLKTRLLIKNKVLCKVYKSLVQEKKYLTDEQFWHRHNFLELSEYQLLERTENIKHLQEVKLELLHEFSQPARVFYDKDDPQYLKKEISNLSLVSSKAEEINNATHEAIYQQIEQLYLKDMKFYKQCIREETFIDNEGFSQVARESHPQPIKEEHTMQATVAKPMHIPETNAKFEVKGDSLVQFLNRNRPRKTDPNSTNPMRDITIKTVEYLKIFYDRMTHEDADKLQKEIRNLQKEVEVDRTGELSKFIQRSIDNYMKQRRQMSASYS